MRVRFFITLLAAGMFCCCTGTKDNEPVPVRLWDGGPYWADRNIGAEKPSDYGDLLAWGESTPKENYNWRNYSLCNGSDHGLNKYCSDSRFGNVDGRRGLGQEDDAAARLLGFGWRTPSEEDFKMLREKCEWTWTTVDGHNGYTVKGPNGNSIFLPAAGYSGGNGLAYREGMGFYWTTTQDSVTDYKAREFYFNEIFGNCYSRGRDCGRSVRAIADRLDDYQLSIEADCRFTGRGNEKEPLLNVSLKVRRLRRPVEVKNIAFEVKAESGDISAVTLLENGKVLETRPWQGDGEVCFSIGRKLKGDAEFTLCADIAAEAAEGGKVYARLTGAEVNGEEALPQANPEAEREILLVRKCLFAPGDYGSQFYRIPALRVLSDGTILVANDRRNISESDLPCPIDVVSRYSTDGGFTWSEPVFIARSHSYMSGCGDPALVECEDGTVLCLFAGGETFARSCPENPQRSFVARSTDRGRTWSAPEEITSLIWGPTAQDTAGRKYCSSFFSSGTGLCLTRGEHKGRVMVSNVLTYNEGTRLCNHAVYSDDNGKSWHLSDVAFPDTGDEAKMVELADGRILMSIRQYGPRAFAISEDGGQTWGNRGVWPEMTVTNCNGEIIRYNDTILLHSVPNSMNRRDVSIFLSFDEGKTWPRHKRICVGGSQYSSLAVLPDGTIGAYIEEKTAGEELWFESFSIGWLMSR